MVSIATVSIAIASTAMVSVARAHWPRAGAGVVRARVRVVRVSVGN